MKDSDPTQARLASMALLASLTAVAVSIVAVTRSPGTDGAADTRPRASRLQSVEQRLSRMEQDLQGLRTAQPAENTPSLRRLEQRCAALEQRLASVRPRAGSELKELNKSLAVIRLRVEDLARKLPASMSRPNMSERKRELEKKRRRREPARETPGRKDGLADAK